MCEVCSELRIPKHLWRDDRDIIEIQDEDSLYRRYNQDQNQPGALTGELPATSFNFNDDSCNLKSLCNEPNDVLYDIKNGNHFFTWGVLEIAISAINQISIEFLSDKVNKKATFQVVHKPENCMYPHSEVHVYVDGVYTSPLKTKTARYLLRDQLKKVISVI